MAGVGYSDWQKVDLHIHTSMSKETKNNDYKGTFSVNTLKEKLRQNEVDVFSLTDHNIINVEAYREYYLGSAKDDPLLLLGIELDIEVKSTAGEVKTYHSLLIFNVHDIVNVERINSEIENIYIKKGITSKTDRKVTIDDIVKALPEEDFFFIPHAGNTKSIVSPYRDRIQDAQKMVLLMQSAWEKVPEKTRQKYNEGFDRVLSEAFKNKDDVAYIEFSDNHNINQYPCAHTGDEPVEHEFYYIKGSKSFETLRLAFIDPKSRIKSSEGFGKLNKTLNVIQGLKIEKNMLMAEADLKFSPHLNVIIGGRSSGKSLLMYLLGEKAGLTRPEQISVYKDVVDPTHVKIKCKLDADYKEKTSITGDYLYINQGDIVRYFEAKSLEELAKKSSKNEEYQEAIKLFGAHSVKIREAITHLNEAYKEAYDSGEKRFILHDSSVQHILSETHIVKLDTKSILQKYDFSIELQNDINIIEESMNNIEDLKDAKHVQFSTDDMDVIAKFEGILQRIAAEVSDKKHKTASKINFVGKAEEAIKAINEAQTVEAKAKIEAIAAKSALVDNIAEKFSVIANLKKAASRIADIDYSLSSKIVLNEDVDLVLEVVESTPIKNSIIDSLLGGSEKVTLFVNLLKLLRRDLTVKSHRSNLPADLAKKVESQLQGVFGEISRPKDFLDYHNGETSKNKSPGYNSERYLEIVLQNPKNQVVFIDQPEDNLGNKFIADKLVEIIRNIKFQKQIFLVTHNPSIVVFGDAECITIADNIDKEITYKQIVIEDRSAQKEICGILDGGEYVFNNRSRKYNIKRILREGHAHA